MKFADTDACSAADGDDIAATESLADVDRQALPRKEIDDGQGSEPSTVGQLIGNEIHAPDVIARRGGTPALSMHGGGVPPRPVAR